jgi:hypothetical protein
MCRVRRSSGSSYRKQTAKPYVVAASLIAAILVTGVAFLVPAVSSDSAGNVVSGFPSPPPPLSLQIRDYDITLHLAGEIDTSNTHDTMMHMNAIPKCTGSNVHHISPTCPPPAGIFATHILKGNAILALRDLTDKDSIATDKMERSRGSNLLPTTPLAISNEAIYQNIETQVRHRGLRRALRTLHQNAAELKALLANDYNQTMHEPIDDKPLCLINEDGSYHLCQRTGSTHGAAAPMPTHYMKHHPRHERH